MPQLPTNPPEGKHLPFFFGRAALARSAAPKLQLTGMRAARAQLEPVEFVRKLLYIPHDMILERGVIAGEACSPLSSPPTERLNNGLRTGW